MTAAVGDFPVAVCWDCGGPCLTYKGSKHGWRCRGCIDRYLDEAAAKGDARNRQQRLTGYHGGGTDMTPSVLAEGRRRGDGLAAGRVVSASICEDEREDTDR